MTQPIADLCRDVLAASENRRIDVSGWMETACNAAPMLASECQRLQKRVEELTSILRDCSGMEYCPICHMHLDKGHLPHCRLDAALEQEPHR